MVEFQIKDHIIKKINNNIENLSKEIKELIEEYNNQFFEDKTDEKIYTILNSIQNNISPEYLREFFISEEIFFSGAIETKYFYPQEEVLNRIKTNLELNLNWFSYRESTVKRNYLLRARYSWIIWCLNNIYTKYLYKCARYCKYTVSIYYKKEWYKRGMIDRRFLGEHLNQIFVCNELLEKNQISDLYFAINLCKKLIDRQDYIYIIRIIDVIENRFLQLEDSINRQFIEILALIKENSSPRYNGIINELFNRITL